ncbi:MAG: hypothetical protein ABI867_19860 [Kofleriaceae bacterium]
MAKRVTDAMAQGLTRKRLVCMFGTPAKPNGSFVEVTPRSRAFESAIALATADDHPEEAIDVRFAPGSEPLVTSLEAVLGASDPTMGHHIDSPEGRIIYLPTPKDVAVRAIVDLVRDTAWATPYAERRVARLRLDVSDLRGWDPPEIRCWDGAHITVHSPSGDRFPQGVWSFEAVDLATNRRIGTFECRVPADILDIGSCTPAGERPPGVELGPMATDITLHLPGAPARLEIAVAKDGAPFVRKRMNLEYMTSVCKTSSPSWLYLDP